MGQLEDMSLFIRVVESGSITKAAEHLNLAKSAVSRRLSDLEKRLSIQLISRTTRQSHLTEAGALYYQRAINILEEVNTLNEQTSGSKTKIEGHLKITVPLSFGMLHLIEAIDEFANIHEELTFQIDFSDRHVDLVEEGYEMAIRIGNLKDSSYQAKSITSIHHAFCASPEYLKEKGQPNCLEALSHHDFLQYGVGPLHIQDAHNKAHKVAVKAKFNTNNGDILKQMAIKGHGITYLPTFITYDAIQSGMLTPILSEYHLSVMQAYVVYPKNRFLSQRCRFFIEFLIAKFGNTPYWDQHRHAETG